MDTGGGLKTDRRLEVQEKQQTEDGGKSGGNNWLNVGKGGKVTKSDIENLNESDLEAEFHDAKAGNGEMTFSGTVNLT